MIIADSTCIQGLLHLTDIHGGNKHVVADHRQYAIGNKEHAWLPGFGKRQNVINDRLEEVLFVDYRNYCEKHHQQRGKRQGFLKSLANLMLVGDTGK